MKRGAGWPLAVAVILGATVAGNVWLIRLAGADPSFAVEEDYYRKGVRWDEELAQRAHNEALGWRVRATLSPIEPGRGADLLVALDDSAVAPIADASIVVRALHVGRAAHPVDVTLRPGDAPGAYEAVVPLERPGLWELRIDVRRGKDRFTAVERLDARAGEP